MERDFEIDNSNALLKNGVLYELYNFYEFECMGVSGGGDLVLLFKPWRLGGFARLVVFCQNLDRLVVSPGFGPATVRELDEMGYKAAGDDDDNWLLSQEQSTPADDLFFRFNDSHFIRFHGERALLIEIPDVEGTASAFGSAFPFPSAH